MLTVEDFDFILESLKYSIKMFEEYEAYPSVEFKKKKIEAAVAVMNKVKQAREEVKDKNSI